MSKARGLADLGNAFDDGALSNRNLIINSAMQVAQRGTSKTGIVHGSTSFPTCDRVKFYNSGGAGPTYTVTQEADAPDGFKYSWKVETTTADSSLPAAHYSLLRLGLIEYQDARGLAYGTSSAKKATLSFWVKSSIAGDQDFVLASHGNIQRHHGQTLTINSANTWEYKIFVFDAETDNANTPDSEPNTSLHLSVDLRITAGTNYQGGTFPSSWGARSQNETSNNCLQIGSTANATFQITGVQLEVGDTATPFEHRSYGDELARCQRYCQKIRTGTDAGFGMYHSYISSSAYAPIQLPVTMRATPSASITDGDAVTLFTGGTNYSPTSTGFINASPSSVEVKFATTGNATAGDTGWYRLQTAFTMILNAEL